ncbi:MAG: serine/threonine protein kinase [Vulcanimicrobiota bacterium]
MPPVLPEGSRLRARYKIARLLDSSQLRNIYVAEDTHLRGNTWVVKQMLPVGVDISWAGSLTQRFETEARLISTLEHPNIPKLLDFFIEDSFMYIVREYVPGRDLTAIVNERQGVLSESESLKIGIQLSGLMSYLLRKKLSPVIFRELSLNNLILTPDGKIKLVDFGFSRLFQRETRLGPPDYSAPEQFSDEEDVDGRTLVYNVGALVYHLVSGANPGHSPFNLRPIDELNPNVSEMTCKVVARATSNEKRRRYSNLNDLKRQLQACLDSPKKTKQKPRKSSRPDRPTQPTVAVPSGPSHATQKVLMRHLPKPDSSQAMTWLVGIFLTLVMGGSLIAIYQFFLRPQEGL